MWKLQMHMNRIVTLLLAGACVIANATPATAQAKYYMREKILGMKSTAAQSRTFTPVYFGVFGTCTGGSQSRPIVGCTASDGSSASVSDCSSFPQTTGSTSCTAPIVCGNLTSNTWVRNYAGQNNLGYVYSAAGAKTACEAFADKTGGKGICGWDPSNQSGQYGPVYYLEGGTLYTPDAQFSYLQASTCK